MKNIIQSQFKSYMKEVEKELLKKDKELRNKAATVVMAEIKNILNNPTADSPKKRSGNLIKGLKKANGKFSSIVGFKAPAFHAFLVEYGGDVVRNGKKIGERKPKPFLKPAFERKKKEMIDILSESRV